MKKIGFVIAMSDELEATLSSLEKERIETLEAQPFPIYKYINKDKELYFIKCCIGKVNASAATTYLINKYNIDYLVNAGIAGAGKVGIDIADTIVIDGFVQYDFDVTALGDPLGLLPLIDKVRMDSDKDLTNELKEVLDKNNHKYHVGLAATADRFMSDRDMKDRIIKEFTPACFDMESGAIAHVAILYNIPMISIKTVSDKANSDADYDYALNKPRILKELGRVMGLYYDHLFNS